MTLATVLILVALGLVAIAARLMVRALRHAEQERLARSWRAQLIRDQERGE